MFVQAGFMHLQYVISVCFCPCHVVFAYNYSIIRTIKTKKYYCFYVLVWILSTFLIKFILLEKSFSSKMSIFSLVSVEWNFAINSCKVTSLQPQYQSIPMNPYNCKSRKARLHTNLTKWRKMTHLGIYGLNTYVMIEIPLNVSVWTSQLFLWLVAG